MHVLDLVIGWLMDAARWLLILVLSLVYPQFYSPWTGKVVEIVRPHEIKILKEDGKAENVRLYGIHCPLGGHAFAKDAQKYVSDRLMNRIVEVQPLPGKVGGPWYHPEIEPRDAYGRILALVSIDGESVNKELLRNGIAWWYKPLVPFERGFKRLEALSREAKRGLWNLPNASPSWDFKATPVGQTNPLQEKKLAETPPRSPAPARPKREKAAPHEAPPAVEALPDKAPPTEVASAKTPPETSVPTVKPSVEQPDKIASPESPPPEKAEPTKDDCAEQEYLTRLARAYRAISNVLGRYTYICSQMALNWEERTALAELYQLNPDVWLQAEQVLKKADDPCPRTVELYEHVQELHTLCAQLKSLASPETDDRTAYMSQVAQVRNRSEALVQILNARLAGY